MLELGAKVQLFILILFFSIGEASLCEDGYIEINRVIGENNITECNCNCSMQDNIIYVQNLKDSSIYYKIENVSTVSKKLNQVNISINAKMNYFLSNKKVCKTTNSLLQQKSDLFIYTLLPDSSSKYCYDLSGYINKKGNLILIDNSIVYKRVANIQVEKQALYTTYSRKSKTKMYLIRGDKVEVLDEKMSADNQKWVYILYKGNKELKKWIPKSSIQ